MKYSYSDVKKLKNGHRIQLKNWKMAKFQKFKFLSREKIICKIGEEEITIHINDIIWIAQNYSYSNIKKLPFGYKMFLRNWKMAEFQDFKFMSREKIIVKIDGKETVISISDIAELKTSSFSYFYEDYSLIGCFKSWLEHTYFFDKTFYKFGYKGIIKFYPRTIFHVIKKLIKKLIKK